MRRFLGSSLAFGAIGIAVASLGFSSGARAADTDNYTESQVNVSSQPITCHFATPDTSDFTFDISFVDVARGEFLLADSSHGRLSSDTEGGLLSGATDGDVLVIDVDNPAGGATTILPPRNDPFAGRRCDDNTSFGGVPGNPSRNELSGPNGLFTVNDTEVWVGDGPSRFNPGQTNSAKDYVADPCNSSVRVFSLITKQQTDHINLHGCFRTDEGAFDPIDQVVLIANPSEQGAVAAIDHRAGPLDRSPFISLIAAQTNARGDDQGDQDGNDHGDGGGNQGQGHHTILKQINFDGTNGTINATAGVEQAVYVRQTGLFYIAIPGTAADPNDGYLAVVDPRPGHLDVVKNINLPGCAPTGNALGPNETLMLGCGDQVYDIKTGTLTPIAGPLGVACDEVTYDAGSGHFGSACVTAGANGSHGAFDLLVVDAYAPQTFDVELKGAPGAHSVTADPTTATFWMPAYGGVCGANQACVAVYSGDQSDFAGP
jgi:hypothetical protein